MSQDTPAPSESQTENAQQAVAAPERPAAKPSKSPPKLDKLPPYKVLLHNDDVNDVEFVIRSVMQIASMPTPQAIKVTFEAHRTGVALVTVTHKERAELLVEQFRSRKLISTMEPAEA